MKKLLCLILVVFILVVTGCIEDDDCYRNDCIKESECEHNEYNTITKGTANDIISIVNGLVPLVNECYSQNLSMVDYYVIP